MTTESILSLTMEDRKAALTQLHNKFTWLKSISLCIINLTENLGVTKITEMGILAHIIGI